MTDIGLVARLAGAAAELEAAGRDDVGRAAEAFGALFERATPAEREAAFSIICQLVAEG